MGNSITQAENNGGSNQYNSYRRPLWLLFQNAGTSVDFVGSMTKSFNNVNPPNNDFDWDHEGHWGWRADEILNGKPGQGSLSSWLSGYTPDIALIHLGTNDAIANQTANSTISELGSIIDDLRADNPNVEVYLAKIIYSTRSDWNTRIDAINALIPGLASSKNTANSPVTVVDMNAVIDPSIHLYDRAHPNTTGEQIMAQTWYNAITSALPISLQSFSAKIDQRKVELAWSTATELNSKAFEVEMRADDQEEFESIAQLAAAGHSNIIRNYRFRTDDLEAKRYLFRLKMIDIDGSYEYSKSLEVRMASAFIRSYLSTPQELQLELLQNWSGRLRLEIFNIMGQKAFETKLDPRAGKQLIPLSLSQGIYQISILSSRGIIQSQRIQID
ncbi:MAG: SGNH/GDSL hydrolase family protein [Bacteroidia bacterium]|nr:SGNH/GDSL hydrolase family protein [Bacteroidia bacterium]